MSKHNHRKVAPGSTAFAADIPDTVNMSYRTCKEFIRISSGCQ